MDVKKHMKVWWRNECRLLSFTFVSTILMQHTLQHLWIDGEGPQTSSTCPSNRGGGASSSSTACCLACFAPDHAASSGESAQVTELYTYLQSWQTQLEPGQAIHKHSGFSTSKQRNRRNIESDHTRSKWTIHERTKCGCFCSDQNVNWEICRDTASFCSIYGFRASFPTGLRRREDVQAGRVERRLSDGSKETYMHNWRSEGRAWSFERKRCCYGWRRWNTVFLYMTHDWQKLKTPDANCHIKVQDINGNSGSCLFLLQLHKLLIDRKLSM